MSSSEHCRHHPANNLPPAIDSAVVDPPSTSASILYGKTNNTTQDDDTSPKITTFSPLRNTNIHNYNSPITKLPTYSALSGSHKLLDQGTETTGNSLNSSSYPFDRSSVGTSSPPSPLNCLDLSRSLSIVGGPSVYDVAVAAVRSDERLKGFENVIRDRYVAFVKTSEALASSFNEEPGSLVDALSKFHKGFGAFYVEANEQDDEISHRLNESGESGMMFREYIPGDDVERVTIMGQFNGWEAEVSSESGRDGCYDLRKVNSETNIWELFIPSSQISIAKWRENQAYKLNIWMKSGEILKRISPWTRRISREEGTIVNSIIDLNPRRRYTGGELLSMRSFKDSRPCTRDTLRIYELHVGVAVEDQSQTNQGYNYVREKVIRRLPLMGYNALLLVGIQEHVNYTSGGWHVTSPYAVCEAFGTSDDLKQLIEEAHALNIRVLMSVICSHASSAKEEGIGGFEWIYFDKGTVPQWDALVCNHQDIYVQKYYLSCLAYWLDEFNIDGFRFDGVGSMLYKDRAVRYPYPKRHYDYSAFYGDVQNLDLVGSSFLMQANDFIHEKYPGIITIANDHTCTPTLATPNSIGGLGFDFVCSNHLYEPLVQALTFADSSRDWSLNALRFDLDRLSATEKRLAHLETFHTNIVAKRPLLIAFFSWESLHSIAVGGVAPHVTELAAALNRLGHEIHIFTRAKDAVGGVSVVYGVTYHEITFALDRDFIQECSNMCDAFIHAMMEWEKEHKLTFTIIHGHDWLTARAVTTLKGLGRLCVFTMHSTETGRCGNKVFQGNSARIRSIESEACHRADRVICVSGVLADETKAHYGCDQAKIRVVYNGINANNFNGEEDAAAIKSRYGIGPLEPTLLFVGRFVLQKGVDLLVEAIPAILRMRHDVKFVIVGDGHMRKDVELRAQHLNVAHSIRFVGTKTGGELKSLYKMCDAVIIPSRNEPFGIVVLEAWSAKKCVIATSAGGPRDFVSPNVDGFLVDPNPNSIAWGCCQALGNFEHTRWMGERGRVKAAFSFSWDTIGQKTRDIYYELTNKSDAAYGISLTGDCSLAQRVIGTSLYDHMTIFDDHAWTRRGLSILRLFQLLVPALGGDGWINFMGSEFGHPDCIDLPRAGNNYSHTHSIRQLSLSTRKDLKYKHLNLFSATWLELDKTFNFSGERDTYVSLCDEDQKILAFERAQCLFVFNLSPDSSVTDFVIGHSIESSLDGTLKIIMNTDENRFGGWGRLDDAGRYAIYPGCESAYNRKYGIRVYLPARCGLILSSAQRIEELKVESLPRLNYSTVDSLCDELAN